MVTFIVVILSATVISPAPGGGNRRRRSAAATTRAPAPHAVAAGGAGLRCAMFESMQLNSVEKALMNNPVRAAVQRLYEGPLLERLGGKVVGQRVLEVGCGRGVGTEIILERFAAAEVAAFDLDPDMVARARRRLRRFPADRVTVSVGDVTAIAHPAASFDAVFDFGIIHHVPNWPDAVREVARVLRPGGRFFFEEVTRHALERWAYRRFLSHPQENRFTPEGFVTEVERCGMTVAGNVVTRVFGDFVIGVATRQGAPTS